MITDADGFKYAARDKKEFGRLEKAMRPFLEVYEVSTDRGGLSVHFNSVDAIVIEPELFSSRITTIASKGSRSDVKTLGRLFTANEEGFYLKLNNNDFFISYIRKV